MSKKRKDKKGRALHTGELQLKNGMYSYRYTDKLGKRHCIYSWRLTFSDPTPEGKKQTLSLRDMEAEIRRDIEDGLFARDPHLVTLNNFWDKYISMKSDLKEGTLINYIYEYNRFVRDSFGKRPVRDIKYSDVKRYYLSLMKSGLKITMVEHVHSLVHPALTLAVRDGFIRNNPSDMVLSELKKASDYQPQPRMALTVKQQEVFVEYIEKNIEFRRWMPIITVLLGTGMRIGECLGLRWDDVDFKEEMISVNHSLQYRTKVSGASGYVISSPKTAAGNRTIPMLEEVKEVLEKMYARRADFNLENQPVIDGYTNFVFRNLYGSVYNPNVIDDAINRIVKSYNAEETEAAEAEGREPFLLPHISAHNLRHTFCTRYCENESNLKLIQDTMGHADVTTTMQIYAHANPDKKKESFNALKGKFKIK